MTTRALGWSSSKRRSSLRRSQPAASGQTEKTSVRVYVFRFALKLGHRSMQSARLKSANNGSQSHSITSSARASKAAGTVNPSALAVFILMTSWKRVGCSTGKSAG